MQKAKGSEKRRRKIGKKNGVGKGEGGGGLGGWRGLIHVIDACNIP
jgi:hypothetical protein